MTKEELLLKVKEEVKLKGLPLAEDAIEAVVEIMAKLVVEYIETSPSKVDDMALPIVKMVFDLLKVQAGKIDGV